MTVVIPTLIAGPGLRECLASLECQTLRDFEVIVVDNSGKKLARESGAGDFGAKVLEPGRNIGFGAAINDGFRASAAPYIATLNDDAVAQPGWLAALVDAMDRHTEAGMCASRVRLAGEDRLDSAGMLIAADGSSKQRGHGRRPEEFAQEEEVLLPSGSAAMYRRSMLEDTGGFDEDLFLYCEDTDLGLRARWAGWTCVYAPAAVVDHRYSETAGRASPLKAYFAERNRLFVIAKNFPAALLARAPVAAVERYGWHLLNALQGRGAAGQFRRERGGVLEMAFIAARAHCAALFQAPRLWRKRRDVRRRARIGADEFRRAIERYAIHVRQVAAL